MLYDNALLAARTCTAGSVTGEERYRRVAEETLDYLLRELRLPEGGFASAQDADTDGERGPDLHVDAREIEAVARRAAPRLAARRSSAAASILRGAIRRGRRAASCSRRATSARSRRATTRRSPPGTASRSPRSPRRAGGSAATDYLDAARALAEFLLGPLSDGDGRLLPELPRRRGEDRRLPGGLRRRRERPARAVRRRPASCAGSRRRGGSPASRSSSSRTPQHGGFFLTPADGERSSRAEGVRRQPDAVGQRDARRRPAPARPALRRRRRWSARRSASSGSPTRCSPAPPAAVGQLLCALDLHLAPPREVAVVGADAARSLRARRARPRWEPNTVYAFARARRPGGGAVPLLAGEGPRRRTARGVRLRALRLPGAGHECRGADGLTGQVPATVRRSATKAGSASSRRSSAAGTASRPASGSPGTRRGGQGRRRPPPRS